MTIFIGPLVAITSETALATRAYSDLVDQRVADIARRCFASRGKFVKNASNADVGGGNAPNHQTACFDRWELDGALIEAQFSWWWGDENKGTTVRFPLAYLDMTPTAIQAELTAEREAAATREAEKAEASRVAAAEKAEADARAHYEQLKARFEKPPHHA